MKLLAILVLVSCYVAIDGQECGCPNEWTYFDESCYYLADDVAATWDQARDYCISEWGADLVRIDNAVEDRFLQSYCQKLFRTDLTEADTVWTGASDNVTEGEWEWHIGNPEMMYVNWGEGQPDSYHETDQDCMSLYSMDGFTWHDSGCLFEAHPLCEISLLEDY